MTANGPEPTTTYFINEHSTTSPNWPNGWVLVYELSGCGFESSCSHKRFCNKKAKKKIGKNRKYEIFI